MLTRHQINAVQSAAVRTDYYPAAPQPKVQWSYIVISAVISIGIIALSHAVFSAVLFTINGGF